MSIGNFKAHLPETTAFVLRTLLGTQTELIDKILVGKNRSSMNFLSVSSDSTSHILPLNCPWSCPYKVLLWRIIRMSFLAKYRTKFPSNSLQEYGVKSPISFVVFAIFARITDASTSACANVPSLTLSSYWVQSTLFFASKPHIGSFVLNRLLVF